MFELKNVKMTTDEGKRNVRFANAIRKQMVGKIVEAIENAGFDVSIAANGDIAIATCIDEGSGKTFYTRLAASLSDKELTYELPKKEKPVAEEIPNLFA